MVSGSPFCRRGRRSFFTYGGKKERLLFFHKVKALLGLVESPWAVRSFVQDVDFDLAPCGVLLTEARVLFLTSFLDAKIVYCPRSCNRVAHGLARFGAGLEHCAVVHWLGQVTS